MDIVEICQRLNSGETMNERDFDLQVVFPKMKQIIQKYGIAYDPEQPIPSDDKQADAVFEAGVEFFSQVGVYCKETRKVTRFSREEILASMKSGRRCFAGDGKDAKEWKPRRPEQTDIRPWCHVGSGILSTTEELFSKFMEGCAAIPRADSVAIPTLNKYQGKDILAGHPFEMLGAIQNVRLAREAMKKAGRPGLPILNMVPTSGTVHGTIAASYPAFGSRLSDG